MLDRHLVPLTAVWFSESHPLPAKDATRIIATEAIKLAFLPDLRVVALTVAGEERWIPEARVIEMVPKQPAAVAAQGAQINADGLTLWASKLPEEPPSPFLQAAEKAAERQAREGQPAFVQPVKVPEKVVEKIASDLAQPVKPYEKRNAAPVQPSKGPSSSNRR